MVKIEIIFLNSFNYNIIMSEFTDFISNHPSFITSKEGNNIMLRQAKLNYKYRDYKGKWKKNPKRRIKNPDLTALLHFCTYVTVKLGYELSTNDIWFVSKNKLNFEIDGWNTGGQVIRLLLTLAILDSERELPYNPLSIEPFPDEKRVPNAKGVIPKGKACMLYWQAIWWTLYCGEKFTVVGGDCENTDALPYVQHKKLFDVFRTLFGINFIGKRETNKEGIDTFTLERGENVGVTMDDKNIECSIHFMDQIIMGKIALTQRGITLPKIKMKNDTPLDNNSRNDYHVDAMLKVAQALKIPYSDSKPESEEDIKVWIKKATERIIEI